MLGLEFGYVPNARLWPERPTVPIDARGAGHDNPRFQKLGTK